MKKQPIVINKGVWRVTRFCCTSGQCMTCRATAHNSVRHIITHIDGIDEDAARAIAANWSSYEALASRMPGMTTAAPVSPADERAHAARKTAERQRRGLR